MCCLGSVYAAMAEKHGQTAAQGPGGRLRPKTLGKNRKPTVRQAGRPFKKRGPFMSRGLLLEAKNMLSLSSSCCTCPQTESASSPRRPTALTPC